MSPPRVWTRFALIEAIRWWIALYGDTPTVQDWNPAMARRDGRSDLAERYERDGIWPSVSTVQKEFGSWRAGIKVAGFEARDAGRHGSVSEFARRQRVTH